jgi:hypothetical protein
MTEPPPEARMAGMACLHPNHTPLTLMFIVRSHTDSSVVSALSSCKQSQQPRRERHGAQTLKGCVAQPH